MLSFVSSVSLAVFVIFGYICSYTWMQALNILIIISRQRRDVTGEKNRMYICNSSSEFQYNSIRHEETSQATQQVSTVSRCLGYAAKQREKSAEQEEKNTVERGKFGNSWDREKGRTDSVCVRVKSIARNIQTSD